MSVHTRYIDLVIGARFPEHPARYVVTANVVADYRAIGGGPACLSDSAPDEVAPPTLAAVYIRPAQNALNGPPGGIHAKQQFTFSAPVRVGDTLETTLEVRELFERNGKRYVVSETHTRNQHGVLVCTGVITQVWGRDA